MPGQNGQLYRLKTSDVSKANAILTEAFQDDPLWKTFLAELKPHQRGDLFEVPLRYCLRYGEAYATSKNLEGIITWVPGDLADMPMWRLVLSGAIWSGMRMAVQLSSKMGAALKPIEQDRKDNMQGIPYIYLPVLGVASRFQGQGFGGKLLRALIAQSEQNALPIYLETETESNVTWYEKFGFTVMKQITLPVVGLPIWEMVRKPSV